MGFRKFVETGRVVYVAEGPLQGKLCAIINIIDSNRVLIDGPCSGIPRQEMPLKKLHLTTMKLKFPWTSPTRIVRKAWMDEKIDDQWAKSRWAQRVKARNIRANLTDFERFKLNGAKIARNKMRRGTYIALLKNSKKSGGLVPKKTRYGKIKKAKK